MTDEEAAEREAFDNWHLNYWRNERGFGRMLTEAEHRERLRLIAGHEVTWAAWQAARNAVGPTGGGDAP